MLPKVHYVGRSVTEIFFTSYVNAYLGRAFKISGAEFCFKNRALGIPVPRVLAGTTAVTSSPAGPGIGVIKVVHSTSDQLVLESRCLIHVFNYKCNNLDICKPIIELIIHPYVHMYIIVTYKLCKFN
jgi:hypothetical protein